MSSLLRNGALCALAVAALGLASCASTQDEGLESPDPESMEPAPSQTPTSDPPPPTEAPPPPPPSEGTP